MDALAMLRLQIEWGADDALEADPVDRLQPAPVRPAPTAPARTAPAGGPAAPRATPAEQALAAAGQADSLAALHAAISGFEGCGLRQTATSTVLSAGSPGSAVMLISDAPNEDEDRSGTPFAGAHGALLDRILASIGLSREMTLLAPLVPWRPPGGRAPTASEVTICLPFLHRLIVLTQPQHIVIFGTHASQILFERSSRRRGPVAWRPLSIRGLSTPIQAIGLGSLLLLSKTTMLRRDTWDAMRMLRRALDMK